MGKEKDKGRFDPVCGFGIAEGAAVEAGQIMSNAAVVAKPRVNLTRLHGVSASNSKHRVDVTPAKRGKGIPSAEDMGRTPAQRLVPNQ